MIIKRFNSVPAMEIEGFEGTTKKIMLGINDSSTDIVMTYFSLEEGGCTPHHTHDFPHLIKVESGIGALVDGHGEEHELMENDFLYIKNGEPHNFKNLGKEPFCFICVVPGKGENYN